VNNSDVSGQFNLKKSIAILNQTSIKGNVEEQEKLFNDPITFTKNNEKLFFFKKKTNHIY